MRPTAIIAIVLTLAVCVPASGLEPVWFDAKRIEKLTKELGSRTHSFFLVSRDRLGRLLFFGTPQKGGVLVAIIGQTSSRTNWVPGGSPVLNGDGGVICYTTPRSLLFSNGEALSRSVGTRFGFTPARDYFFLSEGTNRAGIFRVEDPRKCVLLLPDGFLPHVIFSLTNEIYVFGHRPRGRHARLAACGISYAHNGPEFRLEKEFDLSRFGGVDDMDTDTGRLIVESKGEIVRTWGLYDLRSGRYRSLGLCRGRGLFLTREFRRYLEVRWK